MAILKVARMGHPVLIASAEPVTPADLGTARLQKFIDDMIHTMRDAPGVGLAAPQVHESIRLFVMDPGPREDGSSGLEVVVNPVLSFPEEERIALWEGCLSIPGLRGRTERRACVRVSFLDRDGRARELELNDFPAAVAQHENDHLDGRFFLSRMPDLSRIAFEEEFGRWWSFEGEDEGESEEDESGEAEAGGS
jgi:peptide deformylase